MKDYYTILDVKPNATANEIMEQYSLMIQAWYPKKFELQQQREKAEIKTKEINEAYWVLSDNVKRADYDTLLRRDTDTHIGNVPLTTPNSTGRVTKPEPNTNSLFLPLSNGISMELVLIPEGGFLMGSTDKNKGGTTWDDDMPQHKVMLNRYYIGKYQVTNEQFSVYARASRLVWTMKAGEEQHPVTYVNWSNAVDFCIWASQVTGRQVSLPKEAQWEKAARGTDGRIYPWGNQTPDWTYCNFNDEIHGTTPVGSYSPKGDSPYGIAEMAGNVSEWITDLYDKYFYAHSPADNPQGPETGNERVLRGSNWYSESWALHVAHRNHNPSHYRHPDIGFRVAVVSAPVP